MNSPPTPSQPATKLRRFSGSGHATKLLTRAVNETIEATKKKVDDYLSAPGKAINYNSPFKKALSLAFAKLNVPVVDAVGAIAVNDAGGSQILDYSRSRNIFTVDVDWTRTS
jgi:hypothetical protein